MIFTNKTTCLGALLLWTLAYIPTLFAQQQPYIIQRQFQKPNSIFINDTVYNKKRAKWVNYSAAGGYIAMWGYLGPVWYGKEELSPFHFFNDMHEWQQQDKGGHILGGYHFAHWMIDAYKWSGMPKKRALIQGGVIGFVAMSTVEVFDGFGKSWGASLPDIGANFLGTALAVGNEWAWNEQRIQRKVSYYPSIYTRKDSVAKYGNVLGKNLPEWILKDYNGHINWVSVRVHSFLPESEFKNFYPRWLNWSVGMGGTGMIGRYCQNGQIPGVDCDPISVIKAREYRKYYFGPDIDFGNIRTKSGALHVLFKILNVVRPPLPVLEMDQFGTRVKIR